MAAVPAVSAADVRAARKELARVEKALARLGEREQRLHARMAEASSSGGHAALVDLAREQQELDTEKDELEAAWLEAAETAG